jgi:cytoskeleton protein RodZ
MTELAAGAGGVGEALAHARQEHGLSVADVALQLKFAARQIEALEEGRYAELPAGTFARGMVRSYARLLKLDPEPLVAGIAAQVAVPDNAEAVVAARRPIPITDSARRSNYTYLALSVAFLGVIAAVVFEWQRERARAARMNFVPAAQAPAAPQQQRAPRALASAVTPHLTTLEPEEAPPALSPPAASPPPAGHRIVMRFERESWVEIRDSGGKILTSALNRGGTERAVDGEPPFDLVIGNAQHVRLSYDDRPIDLAPHVKVEVARFTLR